HQALTMGVGTIMEARKVVIMAFGEHKAPIVRKAVEEDISEVVTASFLQKHNDTTFILDQAAAGHLTPIRMPWVIGSVNWTPNLIRRAVIWLSLKVEKGLLKLSDDDFREHELYELLREYGPAHKLGRRVLDEMMATICTCPAGEQDKKTCLVFSPHPDDDVISMGGNIMRLVEQGHRVYIAYMTSGNIAVFDYDAWRFCDFVCSFNELFGLGKEKSAALKRDVAE